MHSGNNSFSHLLCSSNFIQNTVAKYIHIKKRCKRFLRYVTNVDFLKIRRPSSWCVMSLIKRTSPCWLCWKDFSSSTCQFHVTRWLIAPAGGQKLLRGRNLRIFSGRLLGDLGSKRMESFISITISVKIAQIYTQKINTIKFCYFIFLSVSQLNHITWNLPTF